MASRELRRARQNKGESASESIEKRRTNQPLLYGGGIVLLVIVVVSFVLAGPGGPLSSAQRTGTSYLVFGTYNGKDIVEDVPVDVPASLAGFKEAYEQLP